MIQQEKPHPDQKCDFIDVDGYSEAEYVNMANDVVQTSRVEFLKRKEANPEASVFNYGLDIVSSTPR